MELCSSSVQDHYPPFHSFSLSSSSAAAVDDPMPDRRQENRRLPHPSQYRRPPKIAKQRCKTEPEIDHFMLRGNFFSGLDKTTKRLPTGQESDKASEASQGPNSDSWTRPRAKSAILVHRRQPSSPIIFRPTALARAQPLSSHFMPVVRGDYRQNRAGNGGSDVKCRSRFMSDASNASGPPWKDRWEEHLQDGQSRRASSRSDSSGCPVAHFRGRTFTAETVDTGNNIGMPTRHACHKRSRSLPSRQQLGLGSCPEPARRTHSQGYFKPPRRASPCLHPLSHMLKQSGNINALTMLFRRAGGASILPFPEELAAELFPPYRDEQNERALDDRKYSLDDKPQAHCFAAVPDSASGEGSPRAFGREEAWGRRQSIYDVEFWNNELDDSGSVIHAPPSEATRLFDLEAQVVRDLESYVNRSDDGDILHTPFARRYYHTDPPYPELVDAISFPHRSPAASVDGDAHLHLAPHNTPSSSVVGGARCSMDVLESEASHNWPLESLLATLSLEPEEEGSFAPVTPLRRAQGRTKSGLPRIEHVDGDDATISKSG